MRSLSCLVLLCLGACAASAAAPPAKAPAEWLKLIDQLGSGDEDVREAAKKKLFALGDDVLPALRASKGHTDAEVRLAAAALAEAIDREPHREIRRLANDDVATNLAVSPDGRYVVSVYFAGPDARVRDVQTGKLRSRLEGHKTGIYGVDWSADGRRIVTAGADGVLTLWDARTGKESKSIRVGTGPLYSVAFTPDGKKAAVAGFSGDTVSVWDLETGKQTAGNNERKYVVNVAMLPSGKQVVASGVGGEVWLIDVETGKRVRKMSGGVPKYGFSVAAAPVGKLVASAGDDKTIYVWDAATGKLFADLIGHKRNAVRLAFSGDGKRLLSAGDDRTFMIWDVEGGKSITTLTHDNTATNGRFLPDGKHVITSSYDKTLRLWKIRK